jgi:hypothetical protein
MRPLGALTPGLVLAVMVFLLLRNTGWGVLSAMLLAWGAACVFIVGWLAR